VTYHLIPRALPVLALALVIAVLSSLQPSGQAQAQDGAVIRVSPSTQTVPAGGNVLVDITVENAPSFSAYEFHLSFDPTVLDFLTITGEDVFLETTGRDALCFGPDADDLVDSIISFACGSTGAVPGPEGDGVLATLVFSTSCAGTSLLPFAPLAADDLFVEAVSLSDELASPIDVSPVGGVLHVTDAAPCTAPSDVGDASCDETVNSIDAALILQSIAGLLNPLPCEENADANQNGTIDAIDVALVLQFVAGLVANLPP